ncbi:type II asparaginase [Pantoea sp. JGM49]|uniref:type II asparaginase n=1 Tax=Pantoea sp. JGM49 TaxID=2799791 RepID=UPI001BAABFB0|nr:type II asparaginase [Pantoea sp. JGM49]MBS0883739.1 type II asparaginase [Pantoea sp. JGM49]
MKLRVLCASVVIAMTASAMASEVKLPNVKIFATGGTISGGSASKTDTTKYQDGQFNVDALINALPDIKTIANVTGEQVVNVSSEDVDSPTLLKLSAAINRSLEDPNIQGAVVTHGTDTLEETAFFLDLTVNSQKPVVVTGSMRPATAISADGPMNLMEAVSLAGNKNSMNRGVLVAMNDRIGSAAFTTKTNSTTPDTFKATEQGYLGTFIGVDPKFYYPPVKPTGQPHFSIDKVTSLPRVDIIYSYQDFDDVLIKASIRNGAKGIVMDGTGNGDVPKRAMKTLEAAMKKGIPVIFASRTGSGYVTSPKSSEGIGSGYYNAQKSRILLMLSLANGDDLNKIKTYFEK